MRRRAFLNKSMQLTAAAVAAPYLSLPGRANEQLIIGSGEYRYEVNHNWLQLPSEYSWQITHNVAVDREGLVYVIHEGKEELKGHPAIFVFEPNGKFVRAFGSQFQGGGHGLEASPKARSKSFTLR